MADKNPNQLPSASTLQDTDVIIVQQSSTNKATLPVLKTYTTPEPAANVKSFIVDYGAAGDGTTDDTTKINTALAANQTIYDNADFLVTSLPVNPLGCKIKGDYRWLKQDSYLKQQINTYADENQHIFGREYLSSFHKKLIAGTATTIILEGDSTTAGDQISDPNFYLNATLSKIITNTGIPGQTVLNHGLGGYDLTRYLSEGKLATDLATSGLGLIIMRWAINESWLGQTVAQRLAAYDTYLSTIRSDSNYTRDKLALVLCSGSTSTSDANSHKGQIWNEQFNKGLRILARKYFCCYVDIYALWQDSVNGQDYINAVDVSTPNDLIHPQGVYNTWVGSLLFDLIYPKWYLNPLVPTGGATGTFLQKKSAADYDFQWATPAGVNDRGAQPNNTAAPSTYSIGITQDFGTIAGGMPINGLLITYRNSIWSITKQELTSYDSATVMYLRVASGSTWQAWKQVTLT